MQITTLIPAYKPQYLPELLNSLRLQTRPAKQIVFSDDSPNGEFRAALFSDTLAPLRAGLDIECHEGPRHGGGYANMLRLLDIWAGRSELFHLMLDDDVVYPEFYERHLVAHASADISCSVSRRWTANDQGFPLQGQPVPPAVATNANRLLTLDAGFVFMTTAIECKNWFGEFSNAVFRGTTAPVLLKPEFGGVSYAGLWDLGAFMAASLQAPVGYLQDHLGYFRTSPAGNSSKFFGPYMKGAHLGYAALVLGGERIGKYTPEQARGAYGVLAQAMAQRYGSQDDMKPFIALLPQMAAGDALAEASFIELWHAFLRSHNF
jgi:hypothetical protein